MMGTELHNNSMNVVEKLHLLTLFLKANLHPNSSSESYQERLSRLEGDKESLILQVSVLTDQVEAQGLKISDLESSLVEHQHKLNSTEEMLQQELLHRTSLETQKLSLMGEVSYLKLKLADMEGRQTHGAEKQHNAEVGKAKHAMSLWLESFFTVCRYDCFMSQNLFTFIYLLGKIKASGIFILMVYSRSYRLRRTQSGGLQAADPDAGQFKRGGLRATAGPRLTRTPESDYSARDMNIPFSQWTKEQVCGWLEDYGLGQYVNLSRQWVDNGQTLLAATPQDFEKEMGMKNPLHRKKLQFALKAFTSKTVEKSAELDHIWVTRWLDDIGLPQYKDQFHEARVDGRMIQYLTVNDLLTLKVTSQLHHLSIKCAIHVLHVNKFNPNCLRRRPEEEKQPSPSDVVQWSNHRVMEWLRAVDLAEYAPNLRGSGVHGGLIILEPRFSSETLALLLNIPPQKTLLRRHLATAFSALVGPQAMQEKREYGNATGHVPLTTTAKVKPKKLGFTQFSHLRKRKPDESADYICPIDSGALTVNGISRLPSAALRGLSPSLERQAKKLEQAGTKVQTKSPKQ
uniref:SAM domain-containing protein n=1 Tax=Anabas testudineus TaxID=64144 RepID=A0A7N6B206_ANATE